MVRLTVTKAGTAYGIVLCALVLWTGCSSDAAQPAATAPAVTPTTPAATPATVTPAMTPATSSPTPVQTTPGQPAMMPAQNPAAGAAGGGAAMPSDPNTAADPMAMPKPGDNCMERRVSYAKPCTSEPDPCHIATGYDGDNYCLPPVAASEGTQIHFGPSDYKNMDELKKYIIQPGEEFNNSVIASIPTTEEKWWNRMTVHMRPGSHHWISTVVSGKPEVKFYSDTGCGGASSIGSLGGGQNLIYDNPPGGKQAPENEGLGRSMPGNASLCMNLHAYNFTEKPQLRELWINVYFVDEAKVTQKAQGIGMVGGLGLSLAAGDSLVEMYQGKFDAPGRIIQLFGHRHVWTPRFAVWLNEKLVYDSWSWEESATFNYDSLTMNPPIATEMKVDGAVSGELPFKSGDTLKFACYIENMSDKTLRFSNELKDGEMCNLWGSAIGAGVSGNFR